MKELIAVQDVAGGANVEANFFNGPEGYSGALFHLKLVSVGATPSVVLTLDYAFSVKKLVSITWGAAVNTGTETITSNAHGLVNGDLVTTNGTGTPPGGLTNLASYFVVGATTNTFQLSLTSGGAAIDLTSQGTGVNTFACTTETRRTFATFTGLTTAGEYGLVIDPRSVLTGFQQALIGVIPQACKIYARLAFAGTGTNRAGLLISPTQVQSAGHGLS